MHLSKLHIVNFRSFQDETIKFEPYTCFVGPNGAGKSTILTALNILFRHDEGPGSVTTLTREDFHLGNVEDPIEITATLTDLQVGAKDELSAYVRQDQLVMTAKAIWNEELETASVQQYGQRLVMADFAPYFEADDQGARAEKLKKIYQDIREDYSDLPDVWVKADMKGALREYEEAHPSECELIQSTDQFYGWSRGTNRLQKYLQWVYIPAVKDVTEEQDEAKNTALGRVLERTIRQKVDFDEEIRELEQELGEKYQSLLQAQDSVLDDVGGSIQSRLREWAHPGARVNLVWHYDPEKSVSVTEPSARVKVGEGQFLGEILRAGHGMQRSFLVALLHELARGKSNQDTEPTLLLGIEEPELYQHPPQARHLRAVLESLSGSNSQVFVTTHSPYFVTAEGVPNVRMTRRSLDAGGSSVTGVNLSDVSALLASALETDPQEPTELMAKIHQIMRPSQRELFFSRVPVLVEGPEDVAFLSTHLHLSSRWTDFRALGCHFVQCGGKGPMSRPLAIAKAFGIPAFCVFDADQSEDDASNRANNSCLIRLLGYDDDPIPESTLWKSQAVIWRSKILDEVRNEVGEDEWDRAESNARKRTNMLRGVRRKDALLVSATLEELWSGDLQSAILDKACAAILKHARRVMSRMGPEVPVDP